MPVTATSAFKYACVHACLHPLAVPTLPLYMPSTSLISQSRVRALAPSYLQGSMRGMPLACFNLTCDAQT
jgi:hypothetical protein